MGDKTTVNSAARDISAVVHKEAKDQSQQHRRRNEAHKDSKDTPHSGDHELDNFDKRPLGDIAKMDTRTPTQLSQAGKSSPPKRSHEDSSDTPKSGNKHLDEMDPRPTGTGNRSKL